jgi:hypothetical protein
MKLRIFICVLLGMTWGMSALAEENIMFSKANQLYRNKFYDSAATLYQQMITDGYCHPDLFYNAGNAFYKTHQIGMAIWCYRKAQLIHSNRNIEDNLALAQKRIKEPIKPMRDIFFIRWWKSTYGLFSVNQWALFSLVFFLAGMLSVSLRKLNVDVKWPPLFSKVILIMAGVSVLFTLVAFNQATQHYHGILVGKSIRFQEKTGDNSSTLSEGIEVECLEEGKEQIKVKLPDGRVGRIDKSVFKKL